MLGLPRTSLRGDALMHDQAVSKQPELKACAVIAAPAVSAIKPPEQVSSQLVKLRHWFSQQLSKSRIQVVVVMARRTSLHNTNRSNSGRPAQTTALSSLALIGCFGNRQRHLVHALPRCIDCWRQIRQPSIIPTVRSRRCWRNPAHSLGAWTNHQLLTLRLLEANQLTSA